MELIFIPNDLEDYVNTFISLLDRGKRKFFIRCYSDMTPAFMSKVEPLKGKYGFTFIGYDRAKYDEPPHPLIKPLPPKDYENRFKNPLEYDAAFIFTINNFQQVYDEFSDCPPGATIVTSNPIVGSFDNPQINIFGTGVPKSGTHLLLELTKLFGFSSWRPFDIESPATHNPKGQLFSLNKHFHADASELEKLGAREKEFFLSHPMLFIYRDPRDQVVSYLHQREKGNLEGSTIHMHLPDSDTRLLKLIEGIYYSDGKPLIHSLRDYFMGFLPWLDLAEYNVIPVRYEDLIGPSGGGDRERQIKVIWKIQHRLYIQGKTEYFADNVFNAEPGTFSKGSIGSHKETFKQMHYDAFNALPQDFMEGFGYE